MNPYPFASLNHFTVPVAMKKHLLYQLTNGRWEALLPTRYSLCGDLSVAAAPRWACDLAGSSLVRGTPGVLAEWRRPAEVGPGAPPASHHAHALWLALACRPGASRP